MTQTDLFPETVDLAEWNRSELARRNVVLGGGFAIANTKTQKDSRLLAWAMQTGRLLDRDDLRGKVVAQSTALTMQQEMEALRPRHLRQQIERWAREHSISMGGARWYTRHEWRDKLWGDCDLHLVAEPGSWFFQAIWNPDELCMELSHLIESLGYESTHVDSSGAWHFSPLVKMEEAQ
jgi:hypothetical protein